MKQGLVYLVLMARVATVAATATVPVAVLFAAAQRKAPEGTKKKKPKPLTKEEKEILKYREILENLELLRNLEQIQFLNFLSESKESDTGKDPIKSPPKKDAGNQPKQARKPK